MAGKLNNDDTDDLMVEVKPLAAVPDVIKQQETIAGSIGTKSSGKAVKSKAKVRSFSLTDEIYSVVLKKSQEMSVEESKTVSASRALSEIIKQYSGDK